MTGLEGLLCARAFSDFARTVYSVGKANDNERVPAKLR